MGGGLENGVLGSWPVVGLQGVSLTFDLLHQNKGMSVLKSVLADSLHAKIRDPLL